MYHVKRWTRESEKVAVFWKLNLQPLRVDAICVDDIRTHACWCFLQREWETYPQNNPGIQDLLNIPEIQDLLNISQVAEEQKTCSTAYRPQLGVQVT